jgi:hypothetical protein
VLGGCLKSHLKSWPSANDATYKVNDVGVLYRARSGKGGSFDDEKRRRGRPAWQRSPDDTPMRDGNRDRVIGLVTERAARTLCYYLSETNLNVYHWLMRFMDENPIPKVCSCAF